MTLQARGAVVALWVAILAPAWSVSVLEAEIVVPDQFVDIQLAIDAINNGKLLDSVIVVRPGNYGPIDFLGNKITVRSLEGPAQTTITAGGGKPAAWFHFKETREALLEGFTLTGNEERGLVRYENQASPTIRDCRVTANPVGRGVTCFSASPALIACVLSDNKGGGLYIAGQSVQTVELDRCRIAGNSAQLGGGIYCGASSMTLRDCVIEENCATWRGSPEGRGGGALVHGAAQVRFVRCDFLRNVAEVRGGGLYVDNATVTLGGCGFNGNFAGLSGGGVYCRGTEPVEPSPRFEDCLIWLNEALAAGGGIYGENVEPLLECCRVERNTAGAGGGIYHTGGAKLRLDRCEVLGNYASNVAREGGGIWTAASATLENCLIAGNLAAGFGGGLHGQARCTSCTIADNKAQIGGGASVRDQGVLTLVGSILWGNLSANPNLPDPGVHLITQAAQLDPRCSIIQGVSGQDPLFVKPGNLNFGRLVKSEEFVPGGVADCKFQLELPDFWDEANAEQFWLGDYHLRPGSPAIDLTVASDGCPAAPPVDLDSRSRPCGAAADAGAYELCGVASRPAFRRGDANADGRMNIADPIFLLLNLFGSGRAPPCDDAADADDSGRLDVTDALYVLNFLFKGGPAPPPPFPGCGVDCTLDELACGVPGNCS
ncbi:MAG: right-handed parallel beta-helix repeat-containing protein [Planctomycetes bacterium]|nr:right-handed parallel beta-helix repeat-containing protein [Planctomycetota bacterium]